MAVIARGWLVLALTCVVLVASVVVFTVMEVEDGAPESTSMKRLSGTLRRLLLQATWLMYRGQQCMTRIRSQMHRKSVCLFFPRHRMEPRTLGVAGGLANVHLRVLRPRSFCDEDAARD